MSTAAAGPGRGPAAVAPGERGATRIADRVVAKIAALAAREVTGPLPEGAAPPYATVLVRNGAARVRVHIELGYPDDIGGRCGLVRRRVADRVRALTGLRVPEVVVQVERLHLTEASGAARGRTG
ncbi:MULTISPECIES: hypothetical protein [unclassified Streptomyces]|uniref:hypothetical protein n=1 Tax=unclassified Streptomyces TaxID=2593676 RepID=UPI003702B5F5